MEQHTAQAVLVDKTTKAADITKMSDFERIRLVILGGAGVGKSCIVKRFLFKTYSDKYRGTVEDLYNREYDFSGVTLKVFGYNSYNKRYSKNLKCFGIHFYMSRWQQSREYFYFKFRKLFPQKRNRNTLFCLLLCMQELSIKYLYPTILEM